MIILVFLLLCKIMVDSLFPAVIQLLQNNVLSKISIWDNSIRGEREFPFPSIPKNGGLWFQNQMAPAVVAGYSSINDWIILNAYVR